MEGVQVIQNKNYSSNYGKSYNKPRKQYNKVFNYFIQNDHNNEMKY